MLERLREIWLPRFLFLLTTTAALALLLAVPLAPCLDREEGPALVRLFAQDAVVRRTAVASGLGLLVTACVFFRPVPPKEKQRPPDHVVGA
jgi:hypothetical protein